RPSLAEAATQLARGPYHRIVIQPHLLFAGRLVERVRQEADRMRRLRPELEWAVAQPLGPDRLVAEAMADLCRRALGAAGG
ncbi:MAG TPA: hypothetical protein EYP56_10420, partial [Planctomycetaceae bacterium]|nr:hypothetical protein [Planctomycetaceae bacterium]